MKKKTIIFGSFIVLLVFGFIYSQSGILIADDKDGKKNCSSTCADKTGSAQTKSDCGDKNKTMSGAQISDDKNGLATYEFVTDKIHCDGCKGGFSSELMGIAGVKEVEYGETCGVSKMTSIKVFYSAEETTPELVSASVKEKKLEGNCGDDSKCNSKKKDTKS